MKNDSVISTLLLHKLHNIQLEFSATSSNTIQLNSCFQDIWNARLPFNSQTLSFPFAKLQMFFLTLSWQGKRAARFTSLTWHFTCIGQSGNHYCWPLKVTLKIFGLYGVSFDHVRGQNCSCFKQPDFKSGMICRHHREGRQRLLELWW